MTSLRSSNSFLMKRFAFFITFFFAFGALLQAPEASAQEPSISVSPMINELNVKSGRPYEKSLRVVNINQTKDIQVDLEAFDIAIDPDTHNVQIFPEESKQNTKRSLASWITMDGNEEALLSPGEEKNFRYQLDVPEGTVPGDYYGIINVYFSLKGDPSSENQSSVKVRQSIGSLVLVQVSNAGQEVSVSVEDFVSSDVELTPKGDMIVAEVEVTNNLLSYLNLSPYIRIKDTKGELYYESQGLVKRVFPGETTRLSHTFPDSYMFSQIPLILDFELQSRTQEASLYNFEMAIGAERTFVGDLTAPKLFIVLLIALMILFFWYQKKGQHSTARTFKKKKKRKKKK